MIIPPTANEDDRGLVEHLCAELEALRVEHASCATKLAQQQEERVELSRRLNEEFVMLYSLLELSRTISSSLDKDTLLNSVLLLLERIFGLGAVALFEWRQEENALRLMDTSLSTLRAIGVQPISGDELFARQVLLTGQSCMVDDLLTDGGDFCRRYLPEMGAALCAPMESHGCLRGILTAFGANSASFTDRQFLVVTAVAGHLAIAFENAELHRRLKEQSVTDDLTGLLNRRAMNCRLSEEVANATRHARPLSILMIDIDHFKEFNDANGHRAGDDILHRLGELLPRVVRRFDICARFGGEEFVIILPDTDADLAERIACRIRQAVEGITVGGDALHSRLEKTHLTVSIGVATDFECVEIDPEKLLQRADRAMYRAKELGRNRVCVV